MTETVLTIMLKSLPIFIFLVVIETVCALTTTRASDWMRACDIWTLLSTAGHSSIVTETILATCQDVRKCLPISITFIKIETIGIACIGTFYSSDATKATLTWISFTLKICQTIMNIAFIFTLVTDWAAVDYHWVCTSGLRTHLLVTNNITHNALALFT